MLLRPLQTAVAPAGCLSRGICKGSAFKCLHDGLKGHLLLACFAALPAVPYR